MKLSARAMQLSSGKRYISRFQSLIYPLTSIIRLKNALRILQTTQERFASNLNRCQLSTATTGIFKKTDQDQKIDILNKAQCGNDFFEVLKIENDNQFQFSFLAFAFDGEQAFDMVSRTLNDKVICVSKMYKLTLSYKSQRRSRHF